MHARTVDDTVFVYSTRAPSFNTQVHSDYMLMQSGPHDLQGSTFVSWRASEAEQILAEERVTATLSPQRVCHAQLGE